MATIKKYTKKDGSTAYKFNAYLGVDPVTGKKKYTTKRGFPTQKEAKLALSRLQVQIEEHGFKKQHVGTFSEMYELWLESVYVHKVKESTLVKTKELFTNHILPAFGSYKLDKITIKLCQRTVNEWSKTLQKYRTMKNYASNVLDYAVTIEALRDNPMKKISVPKIMENVDEDKFENFYTKEELQHFLSCVEKEFSFKWYAYFRLLAFSGFRKGEALALQWKDIDFRGNTISVSKTLTRGENNTLIVQPPKTKAGMRTISIDEVTMKILKQWKKKQREDYLKLGFNTNKKEQLLFSTLENTFLSHSVVNNHIVKIIDLYGLKKITTHGLRHTHCSLLFEAGAPIQVVKERLGHSDIQTTMNIYTHVTEKAKEDTAKMFAEYVNF